MSLRLLPLFAAASFVAAPAAGANAAVAIALQQPHGCFVDQGPQLGPQPIPYTLTGLAASQAGNVTLSGQGITSTPMPFAGPADGSGTNMAAMSWMSNFAGKATHDVPATLTATDPNGAVLATLPITVGNAGLEIGDGKIHKISKPVDWKVSGLSAITGQSTYFAFFIKYKDAKSTNPKPIASMKLGTGTGACGYVSVKRPLTPFKRLGTFLVIVETSKTFNPKALYLSALIKTKRIR